MHVSVLFPINAEAFTYKVPDELQSEMKVGMRVLAPFKRSEKVGIITSVRRKAGKNDELSKGFKLRSIKSVLDDFSFLPENLLKLISWVGEYYMSSTGLALKNAVPSAMFTGKKSGKPRITFDEEIKRRERLTLTAGQKRALKDINGTEKGVFLLHGVTGSGKTEVYIRAIEALPEGMGAVVLVPEIGITAQMVGRFRSCFGEDVVFYHSGLSTGERIRNWNRIRNDEVRIVIGVRSAVFVPFEKVGLIIIDEEHEASYKQFDGLRYSARDVALAKAKLEGTKVILGSATPSLEAFYAAKKGRIKYIEISDRVDHKTLPDVEIIDMTLEEKKTFSFSDRLLESLKQNLSKGFQSLIMLNRRGYSPFYMCTDCGYTYKCPSCSITLIYHNDTNTLNCHYCGSYLKPKAKCPECNGEGIKYLGAGTQRVEEELNALIPELSFRRMDRDTTRKKLSHYRIVREMEEKKLDLLLGTQMVAKGHDFPEVTISAVVSADIALNMPDFRSGERAFQLFTQLAGRAGRGDVSGKAIIQTYEAEHYIFSYVRNHDYNGFFDRELELRRELAYPPFSKLVRIVLSFRTKEASKRIMKTVSVRVKRIVRQMQQGNRAGVEVLGPVPAPIEKIKNLWRWHMVLKGKNSKELRRNARNILEKINDIKEVKIDVDVDPINLM